VTTSQRKRSLAVTVAL